jgi:hypothetical protein
MHVYILQRILGPHVRQRGTLRRDVLVMKHSGPCLCCRLHREDQGGKNKDGGVTGVEGQSVRWLVLSTWGASGIRQDSVESDGNGDHEGQRDERARDRAPRPQSAIPLCVPLLGSRFLELCPLGFRVQGSGLRVQGSGFRV